MTATRALARCPRLQILTPEPGLERDQQVCLRNLAASFSPDFEESAPGTILLDLLTLPHVRQAPREWIEQTLRKAASLRLPLHLALAPTPDLALLASRHPSTASTLTFTPDPVFSVQYSEVSVQSLADLPLAQLGLSGSQNEQSKVDGRASQDPISKIQDPGSHPADHTSPIPDLELFQLWGITTLGDLAALPRQGLAERLGPGAARLHDIIHGKHHRLLKLHRPPRHFQVTRELEYPLDSLEPLLFLLRRNLDTLCARLKAAQRAAQSIHLALTFDDGDLHLREIRIPDPTRDPPTLLRLLHTHLDTVKAPSPVTVFHLKLLPTLPAESQHHLFERSLRDPNKFADTLARIDALLGPGRLGTPVPLDTHKPDSFELRSAINDGRSAMDDPRSAIRDAKGENTHVAHRTSRISDLRSQIANTALPLRRYRPAIEIHVASELRGRQAHPLALLDGPHPGPITAARGPFPLSGHWWNPTERWQRTEWDIQLADRTLLRLVHLPPDTWTLEGAY
jgi:protein ImuB